MKFGDAIEALKQGEAGHSQRLERTRNVPLVETCGRNQSGVVQG